MVKGVLETVNGRGFNWFITAPKLAGSEAALLRRRGDQLPRGTSLPGWVQDEEKRLLCVTLKIENAPTPPWEKTGAAKFLVLFYWAPSARAAGLNS